MEERTIGGRRAMVCWLGDDMEPAEPGEAVLAKVLFEDGDVLWAAPERPEVAADEWNEADHPRGQPDNAGQFVEKGKGSAGKKAKAAPERGGEEWMAPETYSKVLSAIKQDGLADANPELDAAETKQMVDKYGSVEGGIAAVYEHSLKQGTTAPPKQAPGPLPASGENVTAAMNQFKPYAQEGSLTAFEHDYPASAELLKELHGSLAVAAAAGKQKWFPQAPGPKEGYTSPGFMLALMNAMGNAEGGAAAQQKVTQLFGSVSQAWAPVSWIDGVEDLPTDVIAKGMVLAAQHHPDVDKEGFGNFMQGYVQQALKQQTGAPTAAAAIAAAGGKTEAPFEKKALGEHKHFKASETVNQHQHRVANWVAEKALRNHTYRWQTRKLIEEAKAFAQKNPQVVSELSKGIAQLKAKIGESFAREAAAHMIKGDPKHVAGAMLGKAKQMTGLTLQEMEAKGWIPKSPGAAEKATLQPEQPTAANPLAHGESLAEMAVKTSSSLESLIGALSLAENSALKEKYGSIHAAFEAFQVKAEQQKKAAAEQMASVAAAKLKAGASPAEIEKAKKTTAFYPEPSSPEGKALAAQWNAKYQGKQLTDPAQLAQKVADYKAVAEQVKALGEKEASAAKAAAEKAAAEAKAAQAAQKAKEQEEIAAAKAAKEAELKKIMAEIGVADPNDAQAFQGFVELAGGDYATQNLIAQFKSYQEQGAHKGLPISPFEYAMIESYTGSAFHGVNMALRGEAWSLKTHIFANAVNKALKKLPPWTGEVNRGTTLTTQQQQKYANVGNVVQELAFMSTSKKGGWSGNTKWHVSGKSGRDISHISQHGGEAEVLFPARTFFKIDKVSGQPGGNMEVWMTEVDLF